MVKVIPLKYGTMFKQIFSKPAVFQAFAEDVLGIKLNITTVHTEYEYPETVGFVKTKYDLFAEDVEQRIIVEIQHVKEEDFFDRFLYYHLISLAEQVRSFNEYQFERTVYTIVVLTSVPRDKSVTFSCAISDMSPIDEFGNRVEVYPHRLIFLTPRLINEQTPPEVRAWLALIADSLDQQVEAEAHPRPLFQEMIAAMRQTTISPELLSEIKDDAAWEKAQARFKREARAEGLAEGLAEGRAEGLAEGQASLVQAMHARGSTIAQIAELTGLSEAQIEALLA